MLVTLNISFVSAIAYISVRCVKIPIYCKALHFIHVLVCLAGTTFGIPCPMRLLQCHSSHEQGFLRSERKRVCLYRPFCLPAEVTSRKVKVIRASGTCYCYTGQFWFGEEKCLGKTEDVVAFALFPALWATARQSLSSAHACIFCTDTIICKCLGLSFINWIPNCC